MSPKVIIGYLAGVVLLVAIIVFAGADKTMKTADKNDPERPIAAVEGAFKYDLGEMTNSDIKKHNFIIKNKGKSDLTLANVSTSCDCTYAYLKANGRKSPKFTMHGTSSWRTKVKPGKQAELEVVYEPALMPVRGGVERSVTVATNDPLAPVLEFKITAFVSE